MAERRMISKSIIETDSFLDMPHSTQLLYVHLIINADDDGFLAAPKSVMRIAGCKESDIRILIEKGYIIPFESGVIVVTHWYVHNLIRKDRYKSTNCIEIHQLEMTETKVYQLKQRAATNGIPPGNQLDTNGIPMVENPTTQEKRREEKIIEDNIVVENTNLASAFSYYENNIRPICSAIEKEKIEDDVQRYGVEVFCKAVERAVVRGANNLGYIEGILKKWEVHGYDSARGHNSNSAKSTSQSNRAEDQIDWTRAKDGWGDIEQ